MANIKSVIVRASKTSLPLLAAMTFAVSTQAATTTLQNMRAAFNGESNAHARYPSFATQADSEGDGEAASIFRAAARAEEIHARNPADVIKSLGAVPHATINRSDVKSTRGNLQVAIKGRLASAIRCIRIFYSKPGSITTKMP